MTKPARKRRPGRPTVERKREERIQVRYHPEELDLINEASEAAVSRESWIRKTTLAAAKRAT